MKEKLCHCLCKGLLLQGINDLNWKCRYPDWQYNILYVRGQRIMTLHFTYQFSFNLNSQKCSYVTTLIKSNIFVAVSLAKFSLS